MSARKTGRKNRFPKKNVRCTSRIKNRQLNIESLESRRVFAVGGLVSSDPGYSQDPNSYPSFANVDLPKLHSNPTAGAVLYLWFEGGIQENGYYFYPSDYETKGTSTDSESITTGSKTIRTQSGLSFLPGHRIHIHDNAMSGPLFNGQPTPSIKFMNAIVSSYTPVPGQPGLADLVVNVDVVSGSGTISDWTITNTHFNEAERENIVEIWRQTSKAFAIFNIDVTTDWIDLATKPASLAGVRNTGNGGSIMSDFGMGHTLVNVNATDIQRYASWVLSHEFGHTLNLEHQSNWNTAGLVAAEYGFGYNTFSLPMMGNRDDDNFNPHMMKWSYGQPWNSATVAQDDIAKIAATLTAAGVTPFRTTEPDFSADFGNTAGTAATLTDLGGNDYGRAGIINSLTDVDYFTFTTTVAGYVDIMLAHDVYGADFSLQVESTTAIIAAEDGDTTVSSATRNVYDQHVSLFLPVGTFKIRVASHGNYGDVGPYVVRASRTGTTSIPWRAEDLGFVGTAGYTTNTNSITYTLAGSGADFGQDNNIMNGYHFLSQQLRGDGEIVAQITDVNGANEWSMGGIMIRSNVEGDNGQYVALAMTNDHGYVRFADNGAAARVGPIFQSPGSTIAFDDLFLKITRVGNVFRFYTSQTGATGTWTEIAGSSVTMALPADTYIGLFSAGVGQANGGLGGAQNALQNQRLTVTQFASAVATATGTGILNPPAYPNLNGFTPPTLGTTPVSTNTSVTVTWNNVASQTETGYVLERSEDGVNYKEISAAAEGATPLTSSSFTYVDSAGLHDAERYWYRIRAKSSGAVSNPSNPIIVATKPGPVQTTRNTTLGTNSIALRWDDVDGDTGYKVFRSTSQNGTYTQRGGTLGASVTMFHDSSGKNANTTYWYKIQTLGPSGWTVNSTAFSVDTRWTTSAVANVQSPSKTSTSVNLTWNNFSSATSYKIYRGQAGAHAVFYTEVAAGTSATNSFADGGLNPSTTYVYRVFALNSSGRYSAPSAEFVITTNASGLMMMAGRGGGNGGLLSSGVESSSQIEKTASGANLATPLKSNAGAARVADTKKSSVANSLELALVNIANEQSSRQLRDSVLNILNGKPRKEADRKAIDFIFENASGDL